MMRMRVAYDYDAGVSSKIRCAGEMGMGRREVPRHVSADEEAIAEIAKI